MAEPTTKSGTAPLSEAEQKQLDELQARRDAAAAEQAKKDREDKLATMAPVEALLGLAHTDKVRAACDAVVNDTNIDFATKQLVVNYRQSLDYNLGSLATTITSLKA